MLQLLFVLNQPIAILFFNVIAHWSVKYVATIRPVEFYNAALILLWGILLAINIELNG